jgi:hypothetical protein
MLPGGVTPAILKGIATYSIPGTWPNVPISTKKNTYGQIANNLLAQTITLWFNMQNDGTLGSLEITDLYIETQKSVSCANTTPVAGTSIYTPVPQSIFDYFIKSNIKFTVENLFVLANNVLGGIGPAGITPLAVNKAVDAINNAFDQCRVLVGFSHTDPGLESIQFATITDVNGAEEAVVSNEIISPETVFANMTVYPNPFKTIANFSIVVESDCHVKLEIFTQSGSLLKIILNEDLLSGDVRNIAFDASRYPHSVFHYRLIAGPTTVSGTIMKTK